MKKKKFGWVSTVSIAVIIAVLASFGISGGSGSVSNISNDGITIDSKGLISFESHIALAAQIDQNDVIRNGGPSAPSDPFDYGITKLYYYEDEFGEQQVIDNSWQAAIAPWDWEMTHASYTTKVKEDITAGQVIEFSNQDEAVYLQPMNLEWTNDLDQLQLVSIPQEVTPTVDHEQEELLPDIYNDMGYVLWEDAYGSGIDFRWKNTTGALEKTLEIDSFSSLPALEQFIIDGGNPVLRLNLIFEPPDKQDVDIMVNGEVWDQMSVQQTFDNIVFEKDGEVLWKFSELQYWDSGDEDGQSVATLEKRGNNLYITVLVPYSWLQTATYPVYIDTDTVIDNSIDTTHKFKAERAGPYWTSALIGYVLYLDDNDRLVYSKTINGGSSWYSANNLSPGDIQFFDSCADWEISGDSGTKIHWVAADHDNDEIVYGYLDTSGDSEGTDTIIAAEGNGSVGFGTFREYHHESITKSRGGNICIAIHYIDGTSADFWHFFTSPDGDTWTDEDDPYEGDDNDYMFIYPGNETDDDDIWGVFWDASADEVSLKVYDDSGDSWGDETAIASIVENNNYKQHDGVTRHSDDHLIIAYWNEFNSATADIEVWDINGTGSITQKTDAVENKDESAIISVYINQDTDDIYISYTTGTQWGVTVDVNYVKSDDDGATWDSPVDISDLTDDHKWIGSGASIAGNSGRFAPVWQNDDFGDLMMNRNNSIVFYAENGIDEQVSGNYDDSDEGVQFGGNSPTDSYIEHQSDILIGNRMYGAHRWTDNIDIPQGATITTAYISLYPYSTSFDDMYMTVKFEDAAAGLAFTADDYNISGRTLTDNGVVWSDTSMGVNWHNSPSLVVPLQEIVDDYNCTSLVAVFIPFDDADYRFRPYSHDTSPYQAARIYVEYTDPSGGDISNTPGSIAFGVVGVDSTYWSSGSEPGWSEANEDTKNPSSETGGWTNPTNAYTDGSGNATVESGSPSASHTYSDYSFGLTDVDITKVRIRYDAWTEGNDGGTDTETQVPTAYETQTNLDGAISDIDEDPDSPDGNWADAIADDSDVVAHVSFPTPTGDLTEGADLQEFKIYVRRSTSDETPTVRIDLYESGGLVTSNVLTATNVTSDSGELFAGTWDAGDLVSIDGSNVEAYIYGAESTGDGGTDTETQVPTAYETQTNLDGTVGDIDEDPDSPDGNWADAVDDSLDILAHVSFPTPTGDLTAGADLQEFKIWVKRSTSDETPTVRIDLYEDGGLITSSVLTATNVTSDSGELFAGTWDAGDLVSIDGSGVEAYIFGDAYTGGGSTDTETQIPTAYVAQTNLDGTIADIDDDPDSPDGNWADAVDDSLDILAHVSFPTPTGDPTVGAGLQEFKVWVKRSTALSTPTIYINLYEGGVYRSTTSLTSTSVTSDSGEIFSGTWNASSLTTADGSDVEAYLYGTSAGAAGGESWTNPTSHTDNGGDWTDEPLGYNDNTGNSADNYITAVGWGSWLDLNISAIECDSIRFYTIYHANMDNFECDVYYSGSWHNIASGLPTQEAYVTAEIGSTETVTAARVRFSTSKKNRYANIHDFDFNEISADTYSSVDVGAIEWNVEYDIIGTSSSVDVGAVEWNVEYDLPDTSSSVDVGAVEWNVEYDLDDTYNEQIRVDVSWNAGGDWSTQDTQTLTAGEATYWYDVTSATTWTETKLNNTNFRARVDAVTVGDSSEVYLDWLPVEVTYDEVLGDSDAYFTVTNSGDEVNIDFKATNFTGGVGWTLTGGSPAENTTRMSVFIEGDGSGDGTALTTSNQTLINALASSATIDWEIKLETGTFTDPVEKESTVTLTAILS